MLQTCTFGTLAPVTLVADCRCMYVCMPCHGAIRVPLARGLLGVSLHPRPSLRSSVVGYECTSPSGAVVRLCGLVAQSLSCGVLDAWTLSVWWRRVGWCVARGGDVERRFVLMGCLGAWICAVGLGGVLRNKIR